MQQPCYIGNFKEDGYFLDFVKISIWNDESTFRNCEMFGTNNKQF